MIKKIRSCRDRAGPRDPQGEEQVMQGVGDRIGGDGGPKVTEPIGGCLDDRGKEMLGERSGPGRKAWVFELD